MSLPHTCVFWLKIPGNSCLWKEIRKPQHSREPQPETLQRGLRFPGRAGGGGAGARDALQFYCHEIGSRWKPGKVFTPSWYQAQSEP